MAKSSRRRLIQHPRLFFFDNGVLNGLLGSFAVSADRRGLLFENLMYSQLLASLQASGRNSRISSYRTENNSEVDFIVESETDLWAIEVKASTNFRANDVCGLNSFAEYYGKPHRAVVAYLGSSPQKIGAVDILPWQDLLRQFDEG